MEQLKKAGVDLAQPDTVRAVIDQLDDLVTRLERELGLPGHAVPPSGPRRRPAASAAEPYAAPSPNRCSAPLPHTGPIVAAEALERAGGSLDAPLLAAAPPPC